MYCLQELPFFFTLQNIEHFTYTFLTDHVHSATLCDQICVKQENLFR